MAHDKKLYLNETEASFRYGYSIAWFQRQRWQGTGPSFIKIYNGRVLYPIKETDKWFKSFPLIKNERELNNQDLAQDVI